MQTRTIYIQTGYNKGIAFDPSDTAALTAALSRASVVRGDGDEKPLVATSEPLDITFVNPPSSIADQAAADLALATKEGGAL